MDFRRTMEIIDNFLNVTDFNNIKNKVINWHFSWFYQQNVSAEDEENEPRSLYFTHMFYDKNTINSDHFYVLEPVFKKINLKALIRVKGNCYPRSDKIVYHKPHTDYKYEHKGLILSLNDCNGYTVIGDKKIESKANRALFFDPSVEHNSTNCTDEKARFNINFNYF